MNTMVCFRAAGAAYCLPVDNTRSVRRTVGLVALPGAGPDVVGIIPGDPPLTVISVLGAGGDHILVIEAGERLFGLQVESVTGLRGLPRLTCRRPRRDKTWP